MREGSRILVRLGASKGFSGISELETLVKDIEKDLTVEKGKRTKEST